MLLASLVPVASDGPVVTVPFVELSLGAGAFPGPDAVEELAPELDTPVPVVPTFVFWLFVGSGPGAPAGVGAVGSACAPDGGTELCELSTPGVAGTLAGSVAVDVASSAWALPAKKISATTTIALAKSTRSASFADAT